jgi:hypothetical protein
MRNAGGLEAVVQLREGLPLLVKKRQLAAGLTVVFSLPVFVLLVRWYDAPLVLGAVALLAAAGFLFIWPEVATLMVIFVLYSNGAALAVQSYGVPKFAAAGFTLILAIPLFNYLILRRERLRIDWVLSMMLVFLLALLVSSLAARDHAIAADRIATFVLEGVVLYLLIVNVVRTQTTLKRVIWVMLMVGSLLGALTLYQAVTGSYDQQFGGFAQRNLRFELEGPKAPKAGQVAPPIRRVERADGPIGDPNIFAQILVVLLPLAFFRYRGEGSRWLRGAALGAGGFILAGILLTYSRGAFIALVLMIVIMTMMRYFKPSHVVMTAAAVALLVAVINPAYYKRVGTIATAKSMFSSETTVRADSAIRGRTTEMLAALLTFVDHPILGVGPGQYAPFYSVAYQTRPEIAFKQLHETRRAHNLYLEMAAETGLIGVTVFMVIAIGVLVQLHRARRRWIEARPDLAALATALWLSIVAYLGTGLFLQLSHERYYWFLLALAGAALHIFRAEEETEKANRERAVVVGLR